MILISSANKRIANNISAMLGQSISSDASSRASSLSTSKTEEKRAGRISLLDPNAVNAALKQTRRAIAGKDTSFIGSIHGLRGGQALANRSSMLQSAPQNVTGI